MVHSFCRVFFIMNILFACVALGLFAIPCALSIKCEFCNTITKSKNAPSCNMTVNQVSECGPGFDRCGTVTVTMGSPDEPPMQMKNCSNALACDPEKFHMCGLVKNILNRTGIPLKTCEYTCCKGDGCNSIKAEPKPITEANPVVEPTTQDGQRTLGNDYVTGGGVRSAAAHFGAIFFAFVLAFVC